MDFDVKTFEETLRDGLSEFGLDLDFGQLDLMTKFAKVIVEVNQGLNLTRILEPTEMAVKNFLDSLSVLLLDLEDDLNVLDLGTGAGFPGVPLAIVRSDWSIVLLDSLRKRLDFLDEACSDLGLSNIRTFHARAEDGGRDPNFRESFDLVVSRAVANLPVLLELSIPFVKVGGYFVAFKAADAAAELNSSGRAIKELNCKLEQVFPLKLPLEMGERNLLIFKKIGATPKLYPRKPGTPARKPII
ncbi:MAG TPA: 16S rRNA (guanine(527)-N(7))-methyltransferase RsmG [Natronincola sp.]|nr:16S rRNA (guanine(527)-N(7))-methyltransferase RsmG [Natronincola sp.]